MRQSVLTGSLKQGAAKLTTKVCDLRSLSPAQNLSHLSPKRAGGPNIMG